ncbi:unnamed protein product [Vitrella brassicaformis CCMP3155]|uniref:Uncharacterized protein n=1 Tax=Vitrella brassicaformis (strain CCMP3155) TaxID=1169540 RepID=A0A0G4G2S0_VITBC|nr:unnamed protein product [Vitrella brassicaformis CCMP3155]|eukprot:CEM22575.1 unnamed protein product [Vitrella brassicaformis CCMP3155]
MRMPLVRACTRSAFILPLPCPPAITLSPVRPFSSTTQGKKPSESPLPPSLRHSPADAGLVQGDGRSLKIIKQDALAKSRDDALSRGEDGTEVVPAPEPPERSPLAFWNYCTDITIWAIARYPTCLTRDEMKEWDHKRRLLKGREEEVQKVVNTLCKTKRVPLLVPQAPPGTKQVAERSAFVARLIMESITQRVVSGTTHKQLNGRQVVIFDLDRFASDIDVLIQLMKRDPSTEMHMRLKLTEEIRKTLRDATDHVMPGVVYRGPIVFIDDLQKVFFSADGGKKERNAGLVAVAAILGPMIKTGKVKCVGVTSMEDFQVSLAGKKNDIFLPVMADLKKHVVVKYRTAWHGGKASVEEYEEFINEGNPLGRRLYQLFEILLYICVALLIAVIIWFTLYGSFMRTE